MVVHKPLLESTLRFLNKTGNVYALVGIHGCGAFGNGKILAPSANMLSDPVETTSARESFSPLEVSTDLAPPRKGVLCLCTSDGDITKLRGQCLQRRVSSP